MVKSDHNSKISFYYDTDHNEKLFRAISHKFVNSELISQKSIKILKPSTSECQDIINDIENDYSKYIYYKYKTPHFSIQALVKKWQRLGFSEKSIQRKFRKYKIKREFEKWITYFSNSSCEIVAAWCPIKPKRKIIFEAALFCKKALLYFEDSPIPGFIICDHIGINGGLSVKKDMGFHLFIEEDKFPKIDYDLGEIFENIQQRKQIKRKSKLQKSKSFDFKKKMIYCPLQVQDDTQIVRYGSWIKSIDHFIDLIHEASRYLPKDWQLVVREHPSSRISYSKKLVALSDDRLIIDNDTDSIEIIKRSKALVTINSSVGFHALLKNKPVIVCGDAFWGFSPITYTANNKHELLEKFSNINSLKPDSYSINKYVKFILKQKFIPTNYDKDSYKINSEGLTMIYKSALESLDYYKKFKK
jgi:capsular polysaccharide export protein